MKEYFVVAKGNIDVIVKKLNLTLSYSKQQKIEKIWDQLTKQNHSLFNGKSPIVINIIHKSEKIVIETIFVDYKTILADRKDPSLEINVNQIGVSGIIILNDDKIVFGERSKSITEYPSMIELIPSGNLEMNDVKNGQIDFVSKLKKEFGEETKIKNDLIFKIHPFILVKDNKNQVYDICCKLIINKNGNEFLNLFSKNSEYENIILVKHKELNTFLSKNNDRIVPTSKAILSNLF